MNNITWYEDSGWAHSYPGHLFLISFTPSPGAMAWSVYPQTKSAILSASSIEEALSFLMKKYEDVMVHAITRLDNPTIFLPRWLSTIGSRGEPPPSSLSELAAQGEKKRTHSPRSRTRKRKG